MINVSDIFKVQISTVSLCLDNPGNSKFNLDGFGVTWYTNTLSDFDKHVDGPRPALYKTTSIPYVFINVQDAYGHT